MKFILNYIRKEDMVALCGGHFAWRGGHCGSVDQ